MMYMNCFSFRWKLIISLIDHQCRDIHNLWHQIYFFFSWDNGECERMSPWDLEPIDEDSKYELNMRGHSFERGYHMSQLCVFL